MGQIINLESRRPQAKQTSPADGETLRLWLWSMEYDDLVGSAIAHQKLPPQELAAIIAHRLGALIAASPHSEELLAFCSMVTERVLRSKDKGA